MFTDGLTVLVVGTQGAAFRGSHGPGRTRLAPTCSGEGWAGKVAAFRVQSAAHQVSRGMVIFHFLKVVLPHLVVPPAVQVEHADAAAHGDVVPVGVEGREVDHQRVEPLLDLRGDGIEQVVQRAELSEGNRLRHRRHGQGLHR